MKKFKKYDLKGTGSSFLEKTAEAIFYFGIISGVILIILSLGKEDIVFTLVGGIVIINSIFFKAFAIVIASINDNIEALKQYKKNEIKVEKSQKIEEDRPFDPLTD
jgi:hypothetical protein